MKYELMYRDASNYKFRVTAEINKEMKVAIGTEDGDTITMEELGYTQKEFFDEFIHYPIDNEVDHNILDVIGTLPDDEEVQITTK